ncbi:spermidine/putrescine ABC transporter ATP-binding subunit [Pseudomonas mandelii JR-1]|uniref:Spermidine/putrescine ABC transporter ATP-binding subunit n=1 Tax=Pseudomonas mandelii JR-1 TaxID=1147786 RepID=A0A024EAR1_9PSED|nr:spermidine/putrescine ABC transporter ATP-binding subunit [Pseudomonas mandelii JR-1]
MLQKGEGRHSGPAWTSEKSESTFWLENLLWRGSVLPLECAALPKGLMRSL